MIVLSAGHNPKAQGACWNGHCEHPEAVKWVAMMAEQLRQLDVPVHTVPTGSLRQKINHINQLHRDTPVTLALEVHFNSATYAGRGCETLYCPGSVNGKNVATAIQQAMAPLMPPARGVHAGWYQQDHPGREDYPGDVEGDEKPLAFLKRTNPVAVIIEPEFIQRFHIIEAQREACTEAISYVLALIHKGGINAT